MRGPFYAHPEGLISREREGAGTPSEREWWSERRLGAEEQPNSLHADRLLSYDILARIQTESKISVLSKPSMLSWCRAKNKIKRDSESSAPKTARLACAREADHPLRCLFSYSIRSPQSKDSSVKLEDPRIKSQRRGYVFFLSLARSGAFWLVCDSGFGEGGKRGRERESETERDLCEIASISPALIRSPEPKEHSLKFHSIATLNNFGLHRGQKKTSPSSPFLSLSYINTHTHTHIPTWVHSL